jgi:hypothetical protein
MMEDGVWRVLRSESLCYLLHLQFVIFALRLLRVVSEFHHANRKKSTSRPHAEYGEPGWGESGTQRLVEAFDTSNSALKRRIPSRKTLYPSRPWLAVMIRTPRE